ncbi:O-succinylhomoserine sulfhydrylase [Sediminicurvatus halobius]|uniref:O-succinylhomoserine sulfhydrylase n=1 Tax=Sediminicurvatus halobius TaxID=2182432 RepID=A0A2U2MWC9_9GAMM|nr:O-succinylhomoserine sulfhydrylase [Spiribacter halobius]PWG61171.1 O-succinylhomoserine sulfhydrylase [Spiribacter halobius]UEX78992.1 O-succinylhomoserine sulfhydrylase [Spiribacter halobius]
MSEHDHPDWGPATLGLRAGWERTPEQEHSEAIFPTSSFTFANAAEAAARFGGEVPGNIYSRFTNPTVRAFQNRLAAMEGGDACIGTASGMSAILATCMALLNGGEHVVCSYGVFGTTASLFSNHLSRFGLETSFVPLTDYEAWADAIRPNTRMLFLETPSNPLTEVADIERLAALAHDHGAMLVVDNCFCTPALQRPLELGADLIIHSATKYLDGQGRCVGGAVVGDHERVAEKVFGFLRSAGPTMSPFNAWVFLKGLETLALRMRGHGENAQRLAEWLQHQPGVRRVHYPGLPDHPQHALAARQQSGFGGIVSFEVAGGREAAWRVVDGTRLMSITANLGDVRTTITHPATTTHGRNPPEQRAAAGITEGLLRISVGLEDFEDIRRDLAGALAAAGEGA